MIGILAYGSLITHPGHEIESVLDYVIPDVLTPFPVEYARRSQSRAGAPTLVPVPEGCGLPVKAAILVLHDRTSNQQAMNILYRREIHREGNPKIIYDDKVQRLKEDAVLIDHLENYQVAADVYFTTLKTNFTEILDMKRNQEEKADFLAKAAIGSITLGTYEKGLDGLKYLRDNIEAGVMTSLTEVYRQAVLEKAGTSTDLDQARIYFAREKGILA